MAKLDNETSRTFSEFLLLPNLTKKDCSSDKINLKTPLVRFTKKPSLSLNIPMVSAVMQAVSGPNLAIALAKQGGLSFIYCSQPIDEQAEMVNKVKRFKAGFVLSDSNIKEDDTLKDVVSLARTTGHTTMAVTEDGSPHGKLMGVLTSRDYRLEKCNLKDPVNKYMTPFSKTIHAIEGISLEEANDLIWAHKLNSLPIIDKKGNLKFFVFRKDYNQHKMNPSEMIDDEKRFIVGAGINTWDYKERVPALVDAGADILCIDSSDGYSEWQKDTIQYIKSKYNVPVGAGNVVSGDGFKYLADCGADFIKVGIGGGSICITREQKGIGRGQATSVMAVAKARDEYFRKTGTYIPICSDGGIVNDYHMVLALAMGADFIMLGRYFARFDESPSKKMKISGNFVKEYWGEGSNRARNWQRYGTSGNLTFEEGVDVYIPYAGKLSDNVNVSLSKIKSTMVNLGVNTINELQKNARITTVSSLSLREGGAHDVTVRENEYYPSP
ncbi:IMP dehydrogenase [Candidatus Woesearchaeota archaeon]|nr:IMP dehydrogenase [Candidatus Woesearchaeota archaeon]